MARAMASLLVAMLGPAVLLLVSAERPPFMSASQRELVANIARAAAPASSGHPISPAASATLRPSRRSAAPTARRFRSSGAGRFR